MDNQRLLELIWKDEQSLIPDIHRVKHIDPVTFIYGDNMALLRAMKNEMMRGYFNFGIVDPPYGISVGNMNLGATKDSKPRDYEMGEWDNEVPTQEYWNLLNYVCRNLIIWGGNYFTDKFGQVVINDKPEPIKPGRGFYFWDKRNNGMSFADGELALTNMDFSARTIPKSRSLEKNEGEKRHPTHKPSYLYEYLHEQHEMKGLRVLDTHGGSFSHAIATIRTKVNLTIIDKTKSYCKSGIEAYQNALKTPILF